MDLATLTRADLFGEVSFPELPFGRAKGARLEDNSACRQRRLGKALAMPFELEGCLLIGLSMGGLLASLLAQRQGAGTVMALDAPDRLSRGLGLDPHQPFDLVAVFSSQDDPIIRGRTSRWSQLTPYAFDIPGLSHDHDAQRGTLLLPAVGFLYGQTPNQIRLLLEEANDPNSPSGEF
jgi:pimeloyl-ACP methyl ester carboxylesterase